jgi:glycosyltransferase involved in cell wall biosynthesis
LLSGSFNRLYDLDVTLGFVAAVQRLQPAALTLLTNGSSCWERRVSEVGGVVASVPFAEMPGRVQASHAGLSICRTDDSAAIAGALPTKIAEFLATGRPVVVNAGLGDMDTLLARHRCGVVLRDNSREGLDDAAHRLSALVEDDLTPKRCRAAAIEHFDLDEGVTKLLEVYRSVEAGTGSSRGLLTGSQR